MWTVQSWYISNIFRKRTYNWFLKGTTFSSCMYKICIVKINDLQVFKKRWCLSWIDVTIITDLTYGGAIIRLRWADGISGLKLLLMLDRLTFLQVKGGELETNFLEIFPCYANIFMFNNRKNNEFLKKWIMIWNLHSMTNLAGWLRQWWFHTALWKATFLIS